MQVEGVLPLLGFLLQLVGFYQLEDLDEVWGDGVAGEGGVLLGDFDGGVPALD